MIDFLGRIELTGADPHKRDTIVMCLVHVRLNLEHKTGEWFCDWVNQTCIRHTWKWTLCHLQEMLQKCLHTECRQCGTEEHRR